MSPLLMAVAAFFAFILPTFAAILIVTRGRGTAASRLVAVEQLGGQAVVGGFAAESNLATDATHPAVVSGGVEPAAILRPPLVGRIARWPFSRRMLARGERDLEFTQWTISPAAYVVRRLLATLGAGAVAWLALRQPVAPFAAAIAAHLVAGGIVAHQGTRYRLKVGLQVEEVIDILIAHLRAGQSLVQSLSAVGDEAPAPSRHEYGRVTRQIAFGAPISEALRSMERRTPCTPVALLISALNMHHRIGGDLPSLLRTAADSVRDQVRLEDDLRTAAAGQTLAAYVVLALPIMLFAALFWIDRPYINGLLQPGWDLLLVLGAVMEGAGFLVMRTLTRVEL